MATNVILETPSLPKTPRISFSHHLCHKPVSVSVSSLEDYPFRWDSSLPGSTSDFDRTSEISSLLTSPRISFSHDLCHEDHTSVFSLEDYQSNSLFLGFGSDIDLISENPSFPTTPRISFSHHLGHEDYQSDSLLLGFGSDIDLISENPSFPTSPGISFSHDLCHENRSVSVPSLEDYQSDSLLLGFGSDIDLVSENSVFSSRRSSDSLNIYSTVSSLDYFSCSSDFDLISETVGFDFCIGNDTAKQHCSSANELFSDGRIQEKGVASSELIPLSGAVELDRQKNQSGFLRHCKDGHKKRSSLSSLLRSYSTGSLLGCKRFAEFNF